jgi:plasmid stabilization system protein ParE
MKYLVVITDTASSEIEEAYDWLADRDPDAASKWKLGLLDAIAKLETMPLATTLAPESDYFGREIRQLLYGKRQRKYRVLFEIRGTTVTVVRVRHGAQRLLGEE